jgi:hypothetical protein
VSAEGPTHREPELRRGEDSRGASNPPAGLRLSPAEAGRLAGALSAAHLTLEVDERQRQVPPDQRLAPRLYGRWWLLAGQQDDAERASTRLDVPVELDAATTAHLLGLLEQAAAALEAFADRREHGDYLVGPQRFWDQAITLRAWRADLVERQHQRAGHQRDPLRPVAQREAERAR